MTSADVTQSPSCIAELANPRSASSARRNIRTCTDGKAMPIPAPPTTAAANATHAGHPGSATQPNSAAAIPTSTNPARTSRSRSQSGNRPCSAEPADQLNAVTVSGNPAAAGPWPCTAVIVSGRNASMPAKVPASSARERTSPPRPPRSVTVPEGNSLRSANPSAARPAAP